MAGAVVGTLLGAVLFGAIVALAVVIILWRMGHLEELLAKIIQQRKTAGIYSFMHIILAITSHSLLMNSWYIADPRIPGDNPTYDIVEIQPVDSADKSMYDVSIDDNPLYTSTALSSFSATLQESQVVAKGSNQMQHDRNPLYMNTSKPDTHQSLVSPSKLNPYGDYGEKTLQRVASNCSIPEMEDSTEYSAKPVFDSPDYENTEMPQNR